MKKLSLALLALLFLLTLPALAEIEIAFSLESGFYESPMPLTITADMKGAMIYYTTDGSVPDETDALYTSPLTLMWSNEREDVLTHKTGIAPEPFEVTADFPTGHIIRAVAISPNGQRSQVISGTFFIGYNREALYGSAGVMLLAMDPDDLFDDDRGIYVLGRAYEEWAATGAAEADSWKIPANYTQHGSDWERSVTVTWLAPDGGGFTQDMGVRIKGGASRANNQKSLRLIARKKYGEKNVDYALYPDNIRESDGGIVDKYKSFTLRNGGNDADFGRIRDAYISNLATGLRFETAQNQPCIAFINGEYWGLYTLNEEYSDKYIQYHYGIDDNNVITVKCGEIDDGRSEDIALFDEMHDFISCTNMAVAANYEKACAMLDMGSFADYCALHLYIANKDGIFQNNNWQMWRVREPDASHEFADGKWRMMLYDSDFSSGVYDEGKTYKAENIAEVLSGSYEGRHPALLFISLVQNDDFLNLFLQSCCDVRNLYFSKNRASAMLKEMTAQYLPYRVDTLKRFGPQWTLWNPQSHAKSQMQHIGTFFENRPNFFIDLVRSAFEVEGACSITIKISGPGTVHLNGREIPLGKHTSVKYFPGMPLTVTAIADDGAAFTGWRVNSSAVLADANAETTQIIFTKGFTLTAAFE